MGQTFPSWEISLNQFLRKRFFSFSLPHFPNGVDIWKRRTTILNAFLSTRRRWRKRRGNSICTKMLLFMCSRVCCCLHMQDDAREKRRTSHFELDGGKMKSMAQPTNVKAKPLSKLESFFSPSLLRWRTRNVYEKKLLLTLNSLFFPRNEQANEAIDEDRVNWKKSALIRLRSLNWVA